MVSELMVQLDSIKEELVMAKMENESIAAELLMASDTGNEAIQSQDMAQTYVFLMMSRCSRCRFCRWFDAEDSSSSESEDNEMALDSVEDGQYHSVCVKCGHDNFTAASNKGDQSI